MHFYSSRRGHLENQCPQAGNNSKAFKSMDANKNEKLSQFKYFYILLLILIKKIARQYPKTIQLA